MELEQRARLAKDASRLLSALDTNIKDNALQKIADEIVLKSSSIVEANRRDLLRSEVAKLSAPLVKRLKFDELKIIETVDGVLSTISLPDPVGKTLLSTELDEGLQLYKKSCPIGVIGVIFESRPDALVQISTLCLKSGNSVMLKGGSEASETNRILFEIIRDASEKAGVPSGWIQLLEGREEVKLLLLLDDYVDLIIPRGSNEFVRYIMDNTRIPVMGHADGICHAYVDESADIDLAVSLVTDSKVQYAAVCNALETLLVHSAVAVEFLTDLRPVLEQKGVLLYGDVLTQKIIPCLPATEEDWSTEYLDLILSIKVVGSLSEAILHINKYGSGHTDMIVANNTEAVETFMQGVDSGNVFANCSTRFSDGFKYGFGAEVGISTNKLHARGPVGLEGLVTYKYKLYGNGHIVADYADKRKKFKHRSIED